MPVFTILMILIVVASIVTCAITLSRVFAYNRKYHFPEIKYTKLFRVFVKEHIAIAYLMFVLAHLVFTIWFLITL